MQLQEALRDSREIVHLSQLPETGCGAAVLKAVTVLRDRLRARNEERPRIDNDISTDFRYVAGQIAALNRVLNLSQEALKIIKEVSKEEV
jgi:hypothetical protein